MIDIKSYEQKIKEQRIEHGKRVMAREVQNGYGAYGWRDGLDTPMRDLRSDKDAND